MKHSASESQYLQIWRVFSRYTWPFSPVAKLGVVSAGNRIPITIPRREKNPEQKILFFRGEILILVFEVGLFLENLQNFRILYRVSIGIPMETLYKIRKFCRFSKNSPTSKTKIKISPRKNNIFCSGFFSRRGMVMGIRFPALTTPSFATGENGQV